MTGDDNIRDVQSEILTPEEVESAQQDFNAVMAEVVKEQGDQKHSTEHSETKKTADAAVNIGSRASSTTPTAQVTPRSRSTGTSKRGC